MLTTLLATLGLLLLEPTPNQWEVDQRGVTLEVEKPKESALCSTVEDDFYSIIPSYLLYINTDRGNKLEGCSEQPNEASADVVSESNDRKADEATEAGEGVKEQPAEEVAAKKAVEQPKQAPKEQAPTTQPVQQEVRPEPTPAPKPQPKPEPKPEPKQTSNVVGNFNTSHYTATCNGCSGITASGYDVRNTIYSPEGYRIVAADTSILPLGTVIRITYGNGTSFLAKVMDRGGAIKGYKLDVLVANVSEANRLGRVSTTVEIVR